MLLISTVHVLVTLMFCQGLIQKCHASIFMLSGHLSVTLVLYRKFWCTLKREDVIVYNTKCILTTYSSSYPSSSGSPVLGSQSFTKNFSVQLNVAVTAKFRNGIITLTWFTTCAAMLVTPCLKCAAIWLPVCQLKRSQAGL